MQNNRQEMSQKNRAIVKPCCGIGRRTVLERGKKIQSILNMLDPVQRRADDLLEKRSSDKST